MQQHPPDLLGGIGHGLLALVTSQPLATLAIVVVGLVVLNVPQRAGGFRGRRRRPGPWGDRRRWSRGAGATVSKRPPATATQYRRAPVMTANESEFHRRLCAAVGDGFEVWPQVSALALIQVEEHRPGEDWDRFSAFNKVSRWRFDWVLGRGGTAVAVIELDDRTHDAKKEKDAERDTILARCGYEVIRYDSRDKPSVPMIRRDLIALSARL